MRTIGTSIGMIMIPDGTYQGTITGSKVRLQRGNNIFEFEVKEISNFQQQPATIIMKDMRATVSVK